jgi:ankyrin repeat protein
MLIPLIVCPLKEDFDRHCTLACEEESGVEDWPWEEWNPNTVVQSALCICALTQDVADDKIKGLIENGADINQFYYYYRKKDDSIIDYTLLMMKTATSKNEVVEAEIQKLIDNGALTNIKNTQGEDLFLVSIMHNKPSVFEKLLEVGADVGIVNTNGDTTLMYAAQYMPSVIGRLLGTKRVGLEAQNNLGKTALHLAVECENVESIKELLTSDASIYATDKNGVSVLEAAQRTNSKGVFKLFAPLLVSLLVEENAHQFNANNAFVINKLLLYAIKANDQALVYKLLEKGANVNAANDNKFTVLMYAAKVMPSFIPLLVEKGADIEAQDMLGRTALFIAVECKNKESVQNLLAAGASIYLVSSNGTALLSAAQSAGYEEIYKLLNILYAKDYIDMMNAIKSNDEKSAFELIEQKKVIFEGVLLGNTFLMHAAKSMPSLIPKLIEKSPRKILEAKNSLGNSALRVAVEYKNAESIQILLKAGAFVYSKGNDGLTVLEAAQKSDSEEIRKLFAPYIEEEEQRVKVEKETETGK